MKINKTFLLGFLEGAIVALFLWNVMGIGNFFSYGRKPEAGIDVLAQIGNEKLTRDGLANVAGYLVVLENDHYQVLKTGVDEWIEKRLIEKEAKESGVSVSDIYTKQLWGKVHYSDDNLRNYYQEHQSQYGQGFEQVKSQVINEVRWAQYEKSRQEYLESLYEKHHVQLFLKTPKSYVPGLGVAKPNFLRGQQQATPPAPQKPQQPPPIVKFDDLEGRPSQGPKNAPVTLVEFSDFHCPFCKRVVSTLQELMKKYPDKIRHVWRHYPLPMHQGADRTHQASECANEQGKFWEYHDKLFETQGQPKDDAALTAIAKDVGLDQKKFGACLASGKYQALMEKEIQKGNESGVSATPSVFVNGELVPGAYPLDYFVQLVDKNLKAKK